MYYNYSIQAEKVDQRQQQEQHSTFHIHTALHLVAACVRVELWGWILMSYSRFAKGDFNERGSKAK